MSRHVTRFPAGFDYDFRPLSYFEEIDPKTVIVASILGEERRRDVAQRLERGDFPPSGCVDWLTESKLDDGVRKRMGAIHPRFMGGEYLPGIAQDEIEIARVVFASLMQDVTSIRATRVGRRVCYSIVDEYETAFEPCQVWSRRPLTLRELIKFIDGSAHPGDEFGPGLAWPHIMRHVENDFIEDARGLVRVESAFYPQLGPYYHHEIEAYFEEMAAERRRQDAIDDGGPDLSEEEPKNGESGGRR
jgi:hypothetical protein